MSSGYQAGGQRWVNFNDCDEHIATEGGSCPHCRNIELKKQVAALEADKLYMQKVQDELVEQWDNLQEEVADLVLMDEKSTDDIHKLQAQVAALEAAPIGIKVDGAGQIWITFDPGDGRSGMLNLNNIVLEKSAKGITKSIYLDAIREALKQEDKT